MKNIEKSRRRILLIEDNHLSLRIMSRVLQGMGIDVVESNSGKEAIQYAVNEQFFMIFMCVFMPEEVGFNTVKRIRELSVINKDTPIIAVSSFKYDKTNSNMIENGITEVISKPLKQVDLAKLFQNYPLKKSDMVFEIFNKKEFELFYNDNDFKKTIITTFINERESDLKRINRAFESKNIDMIYDALHYMKGSFTYLKAISILELTQQILDLLIDKELSKALLLEKTFNKKYNLLIEELGFYIKKFDKKL